MYHYHAKEYYTLFFPVKNQHIILMAPTRCSKASTYEAIRIPILFSESKIEILL